MNEIQIRPLLPTDGNRVGRLFARAFPGGFSAEEWDWKFHRGPHGSCSVVAEAGGEIVGHYGGIVWPFVGDAGRLDLVEICDTMADPSVRRIGHRPLVARMQEAFLARAAARGIAFCFGCPNEAARRFGTRFLDYRMLEPLLELRSPLARFAGHSEPGAVATVADQFAPSHDRLAQALSRGGGWRADRSRELLNWRYHARPDRYYRVDHVGPSADDPRAFAVVVGVGTIVQLVDLRWVGDDERWVAALLGTLARALAPSGYETFVVGTSAGADAALLVERLGFSSAADRNVPCVGPVKAPIVASVDVLAAAAQVDFRWGDFDFF